MKLTVLMENAVQRSDMVAEHGLSLYLEANGRKVLFDMGQSPAFARNARTLGIDLGEVNFAVLSHGHYDHGGGLKEFLHLNHTAPVYLRKEAFAPHFSHHDKYIGLDPALNGHPRLITTDAPFAPGPGMQLFSCNECPRPFPANNTGLTMAGPEGLVPDDFLHEQYLLIEEAGKRILLSGCSHKGILNLMQWIHPDVLIGGFHLKPVPMNEEGLAILDRTAALLKEYPTRYYTCHCTGIEQYARMKMQMGDALSYLSVGQTISL